MIKTSNVSKAYYDKYVLKEVSIDIPKGNITSLIGSNGAGKSTLLSVVSRLIIGSGKVEVDDIAISAYKAEEFSKKLSVLRQSNDMQSRLTVRELVNFGRYPHSRSRLTLEDKKIVDNAIEYMGLEEYENHFVNELSGGERQRAMIAMVIAQDTDYILLDEPLNNLDMKHSVQIMKLLRKLADEQEKSIILVIHDINFASCYSDYIVALKDGELYKAGRTEEIIKNEVLREVYDMEFDIQEINGNKICLYFT
jgi:ABC-type enterochelin transport system, ATPase component